MFLDSFKEIEGCFPLAAWSKINSITSYNHPKDKQLCEQFIQQHSTIYKTLISSLTPQFYEYTQSICQANALVGTSKMQKIKRIKEFNFSKMMKIIEDDADKNVNTLGHQILYLIVQYTNSQLSACIKQPQLKTYLVDFIEQAFNFLHSQQAQKTQQKFYPSPDDPNFQELYDLTNDIMNFNIQRLLVKLQSLSNKPISQKISKQASFIYTMLYQLVIEKAWGEGKDTIPLKLFEEYKVKLDKLFIKKKKQTKMKTYEQQIQFRLQILARLLIGQSMQIEYLSNNSWLKYLKLQILYVEPDLDFSRFKEAFNILKNQGLPSIEEKFILNILAKQLTESDFQNLFTILPPYLCYLFGYFFLKQQIKVNIFKRSIWKNFAKEFQQDILLKMVEASSQLGYQCHISTIGMYNLIKIKQTNELYHQQVYNWLLQYLPYQAFYNDQQLDEVQTAIFSLLPYNLHEYAIEYLFYVLPLQLKNSQPLFYNYIKLIIITLSIDSYYQQKKSHSAIIHDYCLKQLQQYLFVNPFDYAIINYLKSKIESYKKIFEEHELAKDMDVEIKVNELVNNHYQYETYQACLTLLDYFAIFEELNEIKYEKNFYNKLLMLQKCMEIKTKFLANLQIVRIMIGTVSKDFNTSTMDEQIFAPQYINSINQETILQNFKDKAIIYLKKTEDIVKKSNRKSKKCQLLTQAHQIIRLL